MTEGFLDDGDKEFGSFGFNDDIVDIGCDVSLKLVSVRMQGSLTNERICAS